jgi:hypothetical protein
LSFIYRLAQLSDLIQFDWNRFTSLFLSSPIPFPLFLFTGSSSFFFGFGFGFAFGFGLGFGFGLDSDSGSDLVLVSVSVSPWTSTRLVGEELGRHCHGLRRKRDKLLRYRLMN